MALFGKRVKAIVGIFSPLIQVANLFLGNIIVYEASQGVKFNWINLLKSKLFWITFIITLIYFIVASYNKEVEQKADKDLEKAIYKNSIKLLDIAVHNARKGDFESSNKTLKMFDELQNRRKS